MESCNISLESTVQELSAKVDALQASNEETTQEMTTKLDLADSERSVLKNRVAKLESLAQKVFQTETRIKRESHRLDDVEQTVQKNRTDLESQCSTYPF